MKEQIESGKPWKIQFLLEDFGKNIFKEEYLRYSAEIDKKLEDHHFLNEYKKRLAAIKKEKIEELEKIANEIKGRLEDNGLGETSLSYGSSGVWGYIVKLSSLKDTKVLTDETPKRVLDCINEAEKWIKKEHRNEAILSHIRNLIPKLEELDELRKKNREEIIACELIGKNINILKQQGKLLHYKVLGEVAVAGEDAGQFRVEGNGDLNLKLFGDSVRLDVNAYVKNLNPIFYYRNFHSKHYWWDHTDLSKIMRTRVEGKLSSQKLGTTLRAGVENIKNYTYLANTSVPVTNSSGDITGFKNNASVLQHSGNIQVFTAMLQQKLKFGILHLDGEVVYQKSSEQSILPLPELSAYGNLYIHAGLVKNILQVSLGADVRYFTKYNAPDYSPVIGQFYLQNPENQVAIGGHPMVNVYANLHWKRTRIFLMMYNINQNSGNSRYFLAPHYPISPRIFKIGISWNFFD